ncbi:peptidylprolyl isomerase [Planctomicrobium sp. SH664]|uniref:peptidylprolyl isomerase n=1 Tax=Planctomicrobium sp. SH664 TaxID=3448125 RepID=UPI003F5BA0F2
MRYCLMTLVAFTLFSGLAQAQPAAEAPYKVKFETSKGEFVVEVHPEWAPLGAARFKELVESKFFDNAKFFRVIDGFMVQFGIHADPKIAGEWRSKVIKDDPVKQSNTRGMISFATSGPNSRTTQMFINFVDNSRHLDRTGFAPFAQVVSGMDVVDKLYSGYGEGAPNGRGPDQFRIQKEGNAYLDQQFPNLDFIKSATIVK